MRTNGTVLRIASTGCTDGHGIGLGIGPSECAVENRERIPHWESDKRKFIGDRVCVHGKSASNNLLLFFISTKTAPK